MVQDTQSAPAVRQHAPWRSWPIALGLLFCAAFGVAVSLYLRHPIPALESGVIVAGPLNEEQDEDKPSRLRDLEEKDFRKVELDDIDGGVAWLNTAGPISLKDLRGKVVLLDFWTFCCINCIHTLPTLAKLEKKYANELVVIGIHSAKFENEKVTENIRKAILRYEITHPVVNDANMRIWRRYGISGWPTLVLVDPEGYAVWADSGEGHYATLDYLVGQLIKIHGKKKTLRSGPLRFDLAKFRERGDTPLFFPGKILADEPSKRLFIADSTHHRIVVTDLDGKKTAIAGSGESGNKDGPFASATFNDPQGMALKGDVLYVADRRNHQIRALDLKKQTVSTVAGTGRQGHDRRQGGPGLKVALNSPWDLLLQGDNLFIAMAGHHQIWSLALESGVLSLHAGNGLEDIVDGTLANSSFAQPSGLATDGTYLYVADSEVSGIRAVPTGANGEVRSVVGRGLFEFGDVDGTGAEVRLQHALGVAWHKGRLYIADTYNSKIKEVDPDKRTCRTILGGKKAEWQPGDLFNEPGGLSFTSDKLYIADTNNHRIRVVDLKSKAVSTLALRGVDAPKIMTEAEKPTFPNPRRIKLDQRTVSAMGDLHLDVELPVPDGHKLSPDAQITFLVETLPGAPKPWSVTSNVPAKDSTFRVTVPLDKVSKSAGLQLSVVYYECAAEARAICRVKSLIWEMPLTFDGEGATKPILLQGEALTMK